jgi:hypothetical protein
MRGRIVTHDSKLYQGAHKNHDLQHYWDAHGAMGFGCEILEVCDIEELNQRELYWISQFEDILNIKLDNRSFTESMKINVSKAMGGVPKSLAHREALGMAQKRRFTDKNQLQSNRLAAAKGRAAMLSNDNHRQAHRLSVKTAWEDVEKRRNILAGQQRYWENKRKDKNNGH